MDRSKTTYKISVGDRKTSSITKVNRSIIEVVTNMVINITEIIRV